MYVRGFRVGVFLSRWFGWFFVCIWVWGFFFPARAILLYSCFYVHESREKRKPLVSGINISTKSVLADS